MLAGLALEPSLHRQHPVEEIAQQAELDARRRCKQQSRTMSASELRSGIESDARADREDDAGN